MLGLSTVTWRVHEVQGATLISGFVVLPTFVSPPEISFLALPLMLGIISSRKPFVPAPGLPQVGAVTSEDTHSPTPSPYEDHLYLGYQRLLLANSAALGTDTTF